MRAAQKTPGRNPVRGFFNKSLNIQRLAAESLLQRRNGLLLAAHHAAYPHGVASELGAKSLLNNCGLIGNNQQIGTLFHNIGEHEQYRVTSILLEILKSLVQIGADCGNLIQGGELELADTDLLAVHVEILVVAENEILHGDAVHGRLGLQHFHEKGIGVGNAGNGFQGGNCSLVRSGAGGGLEVYGVAQDSGEHGAGNILGQGNVVVLEHLVQHGAGAANGLGIEHDRIVGGDIPDLVMINNGDNLGILDVCRSLPDVAEIDQSNLLARNIHHGLGRGKAEVLENGGALGVQLGRLNLHAGNGVSAGCLQIMCVSDGSGNGIGIGI